MGVEETKKDMDISNWYLELAYDEWVSLPVPGSRPSARYKVLLFLVNDSGLMK